jgi:KH domain
MGRWKKSKSLANRNRTRKPKRLSSYHPTCLPGLTD